MHCIGSNSGGGGIGDDVVVLEVIRAPSKPRANVYNFSLRKAAVIKMCVANKLKKRYKKIEFGSEINKPNRSSFLTFQKTKPFTVAQKNKYCKLEESASKGWMQYSGESLSSLEQSNENALGTCESIRTCHELFEKSLLKVKVSNYSGKGKRDDFLKKEKSVNERKMKNTCKEGFRLSAGNMEIAGEAAHQQGNCSLSIDRDGYFMTKGCGIKSYGEAESSARTSFESDSSSMNVADDNVSLPIPAREHLGNKRYRENLVKAGLNLDSFLSESVTGIGGCEECCSSHKRNEWQRYSNKGNGTCSFMPSGCNENKIFHEKPSCIQNNIQCKNNSEEYENLSTSSDKDAVRSKNTVHDRVIKDVASELVESCDLLRTDKSSVCTSKQILEPNVREMLSNVLHELSPAAADGLQVTRKPHDVNNSAREVDSEIVLGSTEDCIGSSKEVKMVPSSKKSEIANNIASFDDQFVTETAFSCTIQRNSKEKEQPGISKSSPHSLHILLNSAKEKVARKPEIMKGVESRSSKRTDNEQKTEKLCSLNEANSCLNSDSALNQIQSNWKPCENVKNPNYISNKAEIVRNNKRSHEEENKSLHLLPNNLCEHLKDYSISDNSYNVSVMHDGQHSSESDAGNTYQLTASRSKKAHLSKPEQNIYTFLLKYSELPYTQTSGNSFADATNEQMARQVTPTDNVFSMGIQKEARGPQLNKNIESNNMGSPLSRKPGDQNEHLYLSCFSYIVCSVLSDDNIYQLLSKEEVKYLCYYFDMTPESKELYVRLYNRKYTWHRVADFKYNLNINKAVNDLKSKGFITSDITQESISDLLDLLKVSELKVLCKTLHVTTFGNKQQMKCKLINFAKCQTVFHNSEICKSSDFVKRIILRSLDSHVKLCEEPWQLFQRIGLLFYMNIRHDDYGNSSAFFKKFLVSVMKKAFPDFTVLKKKLVFRTRDELLSFEKAKNLESQLSIWIRKKDWKSVLTIIQQLRIDFNLVLHDEAQSAFALGLPLFLRCCTAGSSYAQSLCIGIEAIQNHVENLDLATEVIDKLLQQHVYMPQHRGKWYVLLIKLLHKKHDCVYAAHIVRKALEDSDVDEVNKYILVKQGVKLISSKNNGLDASFKKYIQDHIKHIPDKPPITTINAKALQCNISGQKAVYVQENENQEKIYSSVEEVVVMYYQSLGYKKGIHSEGGVISTIFGLMFWDIIYKIKIPDVFQNPHQIVPLDLHSGEFYNNRKIEIDNRLSEMKCWTKSEVDNLIEERYKTYEGRSSIINWKWFQNFHEVLELIHCMGMDLVTKLCARLARHYHVAHSGFPDVTVWSPGEDSKCKFVEVKGPGDTLSPNQILWMDFLIKAGATAEVCNVLTTGMKSARAPTSFKNIENS